LFGNRRFLANLWAGVLLDGIFWVLAGFKMPFSRPNCKSLAFYVYAHLTPLKLKDLYSLSPSCDQIAKHPSGMRDFTQEQKGPSGMEDLPLGYEEGLIAEQHVQTCANSSCFYAQTTH